MGLPWITRFPAFAKALFAFLSGFQTHPRHPCAHPLHPRAMPLSWNEIKHRAIAFSKEWHGETREDAEAKSFWDAFFNVFGVQRRTVASFEEPVKKLSGDWAYIDLFWPRTLLAEHKSAGKDLGKAHAQGMEYIRALASSGREKENPRYLIVSDFRRIAIHDLEPEPEPAGDSTRPDALLLSRLPPSFEFPLQDFHKHIRHFFFIAGYKQHRLNPEDPANEEATQLMCDLYDALEVGEYGTDDTGRAGHELKQFLVRLLFCLFAEDNGIFITRSFQLYLLDHTAPDGSDLGPKLHELFEVLNTPEDRRQKNLAADLAQFPYINGDLYRERLALPAFTSAMRAKLLACGTFDWSRISPAVFGSLFQAVMEPKERRQVGAHYTAERNILKVVRSLFLDDLRAEFEKAKALKIGKAQRLAELQKKLASLRFLDPACGCGNFLVITYRELRALELDILIALHGDQQEMTLDDVNKLSLLDVDQMYGIEIEEFPARIAEVALWLADHQANVALGLAFTQAYLRIPLRKSPHIHVANALRQPWSEVLPPAQCSYILGNPPFVGKKEQSAEQKADMEAVWGDVKGTGVLDFVTCWYRKAADYLTAAASHTSSAAQGNETPGLAQETGSARFQRAASGIPAGRRAKAAGLSDAGEEESGAAAQPGGSFRQDAETNTLEAYAPGKQQACVRKEPPACSPDFPRVAFVSTNSICQGEQVSVLWGFLLSRYRVKLHFAHRTFPWESEARGKAHVHVVIIGFGLGDVPAKRLYDYDTDPVNPTVSIVRNISPYLIEGNDTAIPTREQRISKDAPEMMKGSEVTDDGHLLLSTGEKDAFIAETPAIAPYICPFLGGKEYINGLSRWCLWLQSAPPAVIRSSPSVMARLEAVRQFRLTSPKTRTVELAARPSEFGENRQPTTDYLLVPKVSSERRNYLPIGFLPPSIIVSGSALAVPNATLYHFGILSSRMHMAWMRQTCGRMKSDYQYSVTIVYNNYPWPEAPTAAQRSAVETAAQAVLDARAKFMGSARPTLAPGLAQETGSARFQRAASGIPAGRRAKAAGLPDDEEGIAGAVARGGESSRQDAGKDTLEAYAPEMQPACSEKPESSSTLADLYDPLAMPPALASAHAALDRAVDRCYRREPFPSDRARVEHLFALYERLTAPLAPTTKLRRATRHKQL